MGKRVKESDDTTMAERELVDQIDLPLTQHTRVQDEEGADIGDLVEIARQPDQIVSGV